MVQPQQEKEVMGTLLYQLKMESSTLCQAVLESADDNVRSQCTQLLNKSLANQKKVFDIMNQKGWYKVEAAPQDQFNRIQQSFQTMQQQQQMGQIQ